MTERTTTATTARQHTAPLRERAMSISDIRQVALPLLDVFGFSGATLFGSYATGSATEESDIDLLVHVPEETKTKRVFAFAYDLGEALGVDVDAYGSHEVPAESGLYSQIRLTRVAL